MEWHKLKSFGEVIEKISVMEEIQLRKSLLEIKEELKKKLLTKRQYNLVKNKIEYYMDNYIHQRICTYQFYVLNKEKDFIRELRTYLSNNILEAAKYIFSDEFFKENQEKRSKFLNKETFNTDWTYLDIEAIRDFVIDFANTYSLFNKDLKKIIFNYKKLDYKKEKELKDKIYESVKKHKNSNMSFEEITYLNTYISIKLLTRDEIQSLYRLDNIKYNIYIKEFNKLYKIYGDY